MPSSPRPSIVHNDYKLDNCQFEPGEPDRVTSIFDWDMATLGDPLIDLGTLLNYWPDPSDTEENRPIINPGTEHLGLPTRAVVVERYAAGTGLRRWRRGLVRGLRVLEDSGGPATAPHPLPARREHGRPHGDQGRRHRRARRAGRPRYSMPPACGRLRGRFHHKEFLDSTGGRVVCLTSCSELVAAGETTVLAEVEPVTAVEARERPVKPRRGPLTGIRVADFCWMGVGSVATRLLADFGAEVIKIEDRIRIDTPRRLPIYKDEPARNFGEEDIDRGPQPAAACSTTTAATSSASPSTCARRRGGSWPSG